MGIRGIICASQAGCCAALASVCGKLASSSESALRIITLGTATIEQFLGIPIYQFAYEISWIFRGAAICGIFAFNAIMWVQFTKSLHLCSSTLEATAINTSSNFIFTAIFGLLIFGDHIGLQWCCGSLLMVIGLIIMHKGSEDNQRRQASDSQQEDTVTIKDSQEAKQTQGEQKQKVS